MAWHDFQVPNMFFLVKCDSLYRRFPILPVFFAIPESGGIGGGSYLINLPCMVSSCAVHAVEVVSLVHVVTRVHDSFARPVIVHPDLERNAVRRRIIIMISIV